MKIANLIYEIRNAYYDSRTNKIMNCHKNGIVYLHELRHRIQYQNGTIDALNNFSFLLFFVSYSILLAKLNNFSILFFVLAIGCQIMPEIDAWFYAINNYKKYARKNKHDTNRK